MTRKVTALPFADAEKGICRICGSDILTSNGKRHKGRTYCDSHQIEAKIMGQSKRARMAVFLRDLGICKGCGRDCTSYETTDPDTGLFYTVQINREFAWEWCNNVLNQRSDRGIWMIDLGDWDADHGMPLHLVRRDEPDAWKHWTLGNLETLCRPLCHPGKTVKEAKDRGKVRRLNGETKRKPKRKIAKQANPWPAKGTVKLQGRGFQKAGK